MLWLVLSLSSAFTGLPVNPRLNHWRAGWKQRKALSKTGLHLVHRSVCAGHLSSVFCRPISTHYYSEILAQIIRGEVHLFWIKVQSFYLAIFYSPKSGDWASLSTWVTENITDITESWGGLGWTLWFQPPAWQGCPQQLRYIANHAAEETPPLLKPQREHLHF